MQLIVNQRLQLLDLLNRESCSLSDDLSGNSQRLKVLCALQIRLKLALLKALLKSLRQSLLQTLLQTLFQTFGFAGCVSSMTN